LASGDVRLRAERAFVRLFEDRRAVFVDALQNFDAALRSVENLTATAQEPNPLFVLREGFLQLAASAFERRNDRFQASKRFFKGDFVHRVLSFFLNRGAARASPLAPVPLFSPTPLNADAAPLAHFLYFTQTTRFRR
jgi:hypothetical protein